MSNIATDAAVRCFARALIDSDNRLYMHHALVALCTDVLVDTAVGRARPSLGTSRKREPMSSYM